MFLLLLNKLTHFMLRKSKYSKEIEFLLLPWPDRTDSIAFRYKKTVQPRGVPYRFLRFLTNARKIFVSMVNDITYRESYRIKLIIFFFKQRYDKRSLKDTIKLMNFLEPTVTIRDGMFSESEFSL